jgi:hypothetical protein
MIQLRRSHVVVDPDDVERLKSEFQAKQCVLLPKVIEPILLDYLLHRLDAGHWRDRAHLGIGVEVVLDDQLTFHLLHFVTNSPIFLNTVEEITGLGPLTSFGGRVYRFVPNSGHYDSWHNDRAEGRLVGFSLNLSPRGYQGGIFQLRERESKRMLTEIANTGLGDATLFSIVRHLEHQVTEVTGEEPRTAFAGWFFSGKMSLQQCIQASAKR